MSPTMRRFSPEQVLINPKFIDNKMGMPELAKNSPKEER